MINFLFLLGFRQVEIASRAREEGADYAAVPKWQMIDWSFRQEIA